jgi:hypothetical protein
MAQLVARFHGMEEATGSNPVSSTVKAALAREVSQAGAVLGFWAKRQPPPPVQRGPPSQECQRKLGGNAWMMPALSWSAIIRMWAWTAS